MLIPLAESIADLPPAERAIHEAKGQEYMDRHASAEVREQVLSRGYYYTCRHYNRKTGDCMAYDRRPKMCREYPYGRGCEYPGCTRTCVRPPASEGEAIKMEEAVA